MIGSLLLIILYFMSIVFTVKRYKDGDMKGVYGWMAFLLLNIGLQCFPDYAIITITVASSTETI